MPTRRSRCAPVPNGATTIAAARDASLTPRFAAAMAALGLTPDIPMALAVSGGGDSIALMHLVKDWLGANAATVLIVDHGLRAASAKEARLVRGWAKALGFAAEVLTAKDIGAQETAIEERARNARYRLFGAWCRKRGVDHLLVAHSQDDQAETFLLRLARGSGVDGLAAMRAVSPLPVPGFGSVRLCRPLLGIGRAELRDDLARRNVPWLEDPMNADPRFARVRMRGLLPALAEAGLSTARIAEGAAHLARARGALEAATDGFLAAYAHFHTGVVRLDGAALLRQPEEIALRALAAVIARLSGAQYRPRFERLENLFEALKGEGFRGRTLGACRIGKAAKRHAEFGPATLEIRAERPRRKNASTAAASGVESPMAARHGKLPQKGRNRVTI